jgi:hypothetical protein
MPLVGPVLSHRRVVVALNFHRPAMQHWSTHASIFSTVALLSEHGKRDWVTLLAAGHLSLRLSWKKAEYIRSMSTGRELVECQLGI